MGKKFGNVVTEVVVNPTEQHKEELNKLRSSMGANVPEPDPLPEPEPEPAPKKAVKESTARFRVELNDSNARMRSFRIRKDIGQAFDVYCVEHDIDKGTLINIMIQEYIKSHPGDIEFEQF